MWWGPKEILWFKHFLESYNQSNITGKQSELRIESGLRPYLDCDLKYWGRGLRVFNDDSDDIDADRIFVDWRFRLSTPSAVFVDAESRVDSFTSLFDILCFDVDTVVESTMTSESCRILTWSDFLSLSSPWKREMKTWMVTNSFKFGVTYLR